MKLNSWRRIEKFAQFKLSRVFAELNLSSVCAELKLSRFAQS